ncbi:hypothetical protein FH972_008012 [Carpinus fangiana]|uniref:Serpin domain-containing protein n=1 Tax=Carpinus fangiana TaxID=176857 RepID=A0A5N6QY69_9ROSI|nr:hypothetical protein FH972_008012 [Carpinus fangiana]
MDLRSQSDVALRIAKRLLEGEEGKENLVFSPLSIQALLSLVAAGAMDNTLDQLLSFLRAESIDQLNAFTSKLVTLVLADGSRSGGPRLSFANGVWVDKSVSAIKPSFKQVVDTVYKASLVQVDFQTKAEEVRCEVNAWVEKETTGLIKDLLPDGSVSSATLLILANALYFKGAWMETFDILWTKKDDFHLLDGSSVRVWFMSSWERQLVSAFDGFKVLGLPYKRGMDKRRFSMYFFLPDANDGLPALVQKVCSESGFLDRHLPDQKKKVGVFKIPRFKISFRLEASNVLKELGLKLPLFTKMIADHQPELYASQIIHKSFVEVNEQGTEAAAASGTIGYGCCLFSAQEEKIDFVADHPFLFMIREDTTGTLLFIGHVLNPFDSSDTSAQ